MALWLERVGWSIPLTSEHWLPRASELAECKSCRWVLKSIPRSSNMGISSRSYTGLCGMKKKGLFTEKTVCILETVRNQAFRWWSCVLRAGWTSGSIPSFSGSGNRRKLCLQELVWLWSVAPELVKSVPLKLPCQMRTLVKSLCHWHTQK